VLTAKQRPRKAAGDAFTRQRAVDLIITDLVMPTMGGREFIERARQLVPTSRILSTSGLRNAGGQANRHTVFAEAVHEL